MRYLGACQPLAPPSVGAPPPPPATAPRTTAMQRASLVSRLSKMDCSQECIEAASSYILFHRRHAADVAEIWHESFRAAEAERNQDRVLAHLFVLNDVLQKSRKKGPEFVQAFWPKLMPAMKKSDQVLDDKRRAAVAKLVRTWDDRAVFSKSSMNKLKEALGLPVEDVAAAGAATPAAPVEQADVTPYVVEDALATARPAMDAAAACSAKASAVVERARGLTNAEGGGLAAAIENGTVTLAFWETTAKLGKGLTQEAAKNLRTAADALTDAATVARARAEAFEAAHEEIVRLAEKTATLTAGEPAAVGEKRPRDDGGAAGAPPDKQRREADGAGDDSDGEYEP